MGISPALLWSPVGRTTRVSGLSWWDDGGGLCIGAWRAIGAASQVASYVDLSGTGNDLTLDGSISWTAANGWQNTTGRGENGLITPIIANENTTVIARVSNVSAGVHPENSGAAFGTIDQAGAYFVGYPLLATRVKFQWGSDGDIDVAPSITEGVLALAGPRTFIDGVYVGSSTDTVFSATNTRTIDLLRRSNDTYTNRYPMRGYMQCASAYSGRLADEKVVEISARMASL